jgi:phosphatidate cytidylyltransferase
MVDPVHSRPGYYGLFVALPALVIAAILAIPVIRNRAEGQLRLVSLAIFAFIYFGWMFGHLTFLANSPHAYAYLGYLVLAVALSDVAGYLGGRFFGRRMLCSHISPKKTWAGAVCSFSVSLLLPWTLAFTLPHFRPLDLLMCGLIVGIGAQLGDLVVSVFKRDLGIKDMGAAIPGHGGILDRIDSLIYVAPLFFHYVRYRFDFDVGP